MSDPDDPPPAARPPTRSAEAGRRLSQLLARPLGTPAPPGEAPEPYVPRPPRSVPPPAPEPAAAPQPLPAPEAEAPHDTASVAAPPRVAPGEPDLPWFGRPAQATPTLEAAASEPPAGTDAAAPALPAAHEEHETPRDEAPEAGHDSFERRDPPPRTPDHVPAWAWPSALDRGSAETAPARAVDLDAVRNQVTPEPVRAPPPEAPPAAPAAAKALDPDTTRTLGKIRRLMLASNLFMVVAIGAVLTVVGYRIYRTEPAQPPPAPAPVAAPAPAKIPLDMTLTLPRGARIVQSAVAGERLVITLEIDGATEIRTFDVKTLQPTGRMNFATVP